jgi:hypothetical protein
MDIKMSAYLAKLLIKSAVLLCFTCLKSYAVDVEVSEAKINKKLNESFPIERTFDGVTALFVNPQILLNPLDETVKIATMIKSQQGANSFLAEGNLEGQLEYDDIYKLLQMKKPVLRDFKVVESDMTEQQIAKISKIVQQSMGNNLPKITLVDFATFEIIHPRTGPKSIDVAPRRLVIEL